VDVEFEPLMAAQESIILVLVVLIEVIVVDLSVNHLIVLGIIERDL
jgi:hypothetical protein